jgi:uncharacterized protein DUF3658
MNKAQAIKIHGRLLAVNKALSKVDKAISELSAEDRAVFSEPMAELWFRLHGKALRVIYTRYPELQPIPDDFDEISSDLQWKDVTLPDAISAADLDAVILSKLKPHSLKVAKIIGDVVTTFRERELSIDADIVSARIRWLADIGRIESIGDLRNWRYSEIALKG